MRVSPDEYLVLKLRAHELLRDVPIYDVTVVDLPGGGAGRRIADIRRLEQQSAPSAVVRAFFGLRLAMGRLFGWDQSAFRPEDSLLPELSEKDRRDSEVAPGSRLGAFLVLYQFAEEALVETRNATVHGWVCTALAPRGSGYRLYMAVYVRPVSWLSRPYLILIEPFRRFLIYPAMLRRMRRAWIAAYGAAA